MELDYQTIFKEFNKLGIDYFRDSHVGATSQKSL
jgi:hypothetical protein